MPLLAIRLTTFKPIGGKGPDSGAFADYYFGSV